MARVGIYSGTFDPVHEGHVSFAGVARDELGLDRVVFLPERCPRDKQGVGEYDGRVEQLRQRLANHDGLEVADITDEKFTVDGTLPQIEAMFAGCEIVMLMGSDVVKTFAYRWPGLDTLLAKVELCVAMRSGDAQDETRRLLDECGARYVIVRAGHADVSSSVVRARRGDGRGGGEL